MYKKLTQAALIMALSFVFLWLIITYLLPVSLPFLFGAALALLAEGFWRSQQTYSKKTTLFALAGGFDFTPDYYSNYKFHLLPPQYHSFFSSFACRFSAFSYRS